MKIGIWGNELNAWVMGSMLAQCGNQIQFECELAEYHSLSEPGLKELITEQIEFGNITGEKEDIFTSEIHIFSYSANHKERAFSAAQQINQHSDLPTIVINQSNFGIGATEEIFSLLSSEKNHQVAYIPDNLPEGKALDFLRTLSSLIVGCDHQDASMQIQALMRPFMSDVHKILFMSPQEAEFAKFAVTGMLALRIGYINEIANLADVLGVDIEPIRHAMTMDSRISPEYLKPGCGFGGLNFQQYISDFADVLREERQSTLLNSVLQQNEIQKETTFRKLWRLFDGNLEGRTICVWGLSYKPNTSSIDNSPGVKLLDALISQGVQIKVHDPEALPNIKDKYQDQSLLSLFQDQYDALSGCDALIVMTDWRQYSSPDYTRMIKLMSGANIIDGRNILDKYHAKKSGF